MEPSQEILNVVTRFFEALRDGDEEGVGHAPVQAAGLRAVRVRRGRFEDTVRVELKGVEGPRVEGPQKVYPLTIGTSEPLAAVD